MTDEMFLERAVEIVSAWLLHQHVMVFQVTPDQALQLLQSYMSAFHWSDLACYYVFHYQRIDELFPLLWEAVQRRFAQGMDLR